MLLLPSVLPGVTYSEEPWPFKVPLNDALISIGWLYLHNFFELGTFLGAGAYRFAGLGHRMKLYGLTVMGQLDEQEKLSLSEDHALLLYQCANC